MKRGILKLLGNLPAIGFLEVVLLVVIVAVLCSVIGAAMCLLSGTAGSESLPAVTNLLVDPGFESGWTRDNLYWTPEGGPFSNDFAEIFTPQGWTTWWREGFPCATAHTFEEGRPEVQLITPAPDPERVRSGDQAVKMFTYWRCHEFGLLQQVTVEPGDHYDLVAYGHAWHSNCSSRPHDPPLAEDCVTPLPDSWDRLQVGIDPTGGVDPHAEAVVWSTPVEQYGVYGQAMVLQDVEAQGETITVFLRSECNYPLKHDDVYWDDVRLERVERVYLPLVSSGGG